MTRDFLIEFNNERDLLDTYNKLDSIQDNKNENFLEF